jgi:hypothetical protein
MVKLTFYGGVNEIGGTRFFLKNTGDREWIIYKPSNAAFSG